MYITAHVVKRNGEQGINTFLHHHGQNFPWPEDASVLPETNPGEIISKKIQITPGGNRVSAYLDILAPDDATYENISNAVTALLDDLLERKNPTVFKYQNILIRFGVDIGLQPMREEQFKQLYDSALGLYRNHASKVS